jgi:hypothetical protein
VLLRSAHGAY